MRVYTTWCYLTLYINNIKAILQLIMLCNDFTCIYKLLIHVTNYTSEANILLLTF